MLLTIFYCVLSVPASGSCDTKFFGIGIHIELQGQSKEPGLNSNVHTFSIIQVYLHHFHLDKTLDYCMILSLSFMVVLRFCCGYSSFNILYKYRSEVKETDDHRGNRTVLIMCLAVII